MQWYFRNEKKGTVRSNRQNFPAMKVATSLLFAASIIKSVSAHCTFYIHLPFYLPRPLTNSCILLDIWTTLIAGSETSTAAVRLPVNNSPVTDVTSPDITCNVDPGAATDTVSVAAGSTVGFILDNTLYHQGPAAIYLGQVPSGETAATWDGSGANWFKIAEWGATFDPFTFTDFNLSQLSTTIPSDVPAGDYLIRIEQIGLHVVGAPQWYISCAQITVR